MNKIKRIQITLTFHIPHFTFHMPYNFWNMWIQRKDCLSGYERIPMKRILFIITIDPVRKSFTKYTKFRLFDVEKCKVGGESDYCVSKLFLSHKIKGAFLLSVLYGQQHEQSTVNLYFILDPLSRFFCVYNFWRLATCSSCTGMVLPNTEDQYM